eukprot:1814161-Pleurochrysis_carterae.AAC.1
MEAAGTALTALAGAVRAAGKAAESVQRREKTIQPAPVDFTSLGLAGWKQHGALTMFKGKDGVIRFTDGRAVARRS